MTGGPLFGRNFDWLPTKGITEHTLVVVYKGEGKRAFAAVTVTPIEGVISGMNDAGLSHIWQTTPNGGWSAWDNLGKPGTTQVISLAAADSASSNTSRVAASRGAVRRSAKAIASSPPAWAATVSC